MAFTFNVFDSLWLSIMTSPEHLSETFRIALTKNTWDPTADPTVSSVASLTANFITNLSGGAKDKQIVGPGSTVALVSRSAAGVLKFDLSDIGITATTGGTLCARYAILFRSAASYAAVPPLGWVELSSTEMDATLINITWPDPLFETSDNV